MDREIVWHEDGDALIAFVGPMGSEGLFRCFPGAAGGWSFHAVDSSTWDYCHQRAFRNFRTRPVDAADLPAGLPPLPPLTEGLLAEAREIERARHEPGEELLRHPLLLEAIRAAPGGELLLRIVLAEDLYESAFGDGVFHDLEDVAIAADPGAAPEGPTEDAARERRFHVRRAVLAAEEGRVKVLRFERELFDTHTLPEVLEALARRLGSGDARP